jgi:thioredoxin reductase
MRVEPVTIIGAGPAGLAAAIQLKRYGISPVVLEGAAVGGLLHNANLVENYPGFPGGIAGPELVQRFVDQANQTGVAITPQAVTALAEAEGCFRVATPERTYLSRIVVIATGTRPRPFSDFDIPPGLCSRVFYEVYPLLGVEGQRIAIVGAGDAAFDYALNLSRKNHVLILNRGAQVRCLPLLWERSQAAARLTYHARTAIRGLAESASGAITLECSTPAGQLQIKVDCLIGALGREPQLDFAAPAVLTRAAELEARSVLYLIGDVKNGLYRQTAIAAGEGVLAAMKIYRYLEETSL